MRLIHVLAFSTVVAWAGAGAAADDGRMPAIGDPALRLSTSLSRVPGETAEPAAPATEPSFTERTRQPVEALRQASEGRERELLEALAAAKRQQESTVAIERRLAQARGQRYANPVVYTLAALLAAAVAAALVLWRRMRQAKPGSRSAFFLQQ